MRITFPTRLRLAALCSPAAFLLSGCQGIELTASNAAQVRVIDASPDAGSLDSYGNGSGLAYNLGFGTVTSYMAVSTGGYTFSAMRAGTRQTLATSNVTLAAGHQYTQIVGSIAANMQQTLFVDQTQPATEGKIALRVLNESTRPGAVNVYLVAPGGKIAATAPLAANLSFGGNSGYLEAPEGTYALVVAPAGTTPRSSAGTLMRGAQVKYESGAVRTIVLIDAPLLSRLSVDGVPEIAPRPSVAAIVAADAE
jgi:hypothetical protein